MRITDRETSPKARWSLRLALFMGQLIIVTALLHRFASLDTPVAINLIVVSLVGAAVAILLAVLAFIKIWNTGIRGTGLALSGLLVSMMIFAVPLYNLPNLLTLPAINDISTDLLSPPQFQKVANLRDENANSAEYPGTQNITLQAKAYPDIGTLMLERSVGDSFELVRGVIDDLGWKIVNERQPDKNHPTGILEAVDRSMILGYRDDVIVRVRRDRNIARIDMRSASRYGRHDLGSNAKRIREMFGIIKSRIARAEAKKLDALERERIARQTQRAKRLALRKKKNRQKLEAESTPSILPKARFDQVGVNQNPEDEFGVQPSAPGSAVTPSRRRVDPSGFGIVQDLQRQKQRRAVSKRQRKPRKIRRSKRRKKNWTPFSIQIR